MNYLAIVFNDPKSKLSRNFRAMLVIAMAVLTLWTFSILTIGFNLPIYLVAMAAISVLIFLVPTIGLPIIIVGTMWFQRFFTLESIVLGDVVYKLYPLDVVMVVTILSLLFHHVFGKEKPILPFKKIEAVLLFFMLLCVIYMMRAFVASGTDLALAFSAFKNYAFYALLFFLTTYTVRTLDDLKNLIKVFLAGGFGVIFFVLAGIVRGQGLWTEFNPLSTEGIRLLSFPHAFYLSLVIVLALVLYLYRLRPERSTIVTMWIQLIGVLGSLMRHIWISLFFVALFLFVVLPRQAKKGFIKFFGKNAALVVLFVSLIAFVLIIFPVSDIALQLQEVTDPLYSRAQSLARSTADSSARWRIFAWRAAQDAFVTNPLFGVGYGLELTIDFVTYRIVIPMRDLHNSYLVLLVQMGVLGFAVFGYLLWLVLRRFYGAFKVRGSLWPYQLAIFSMLLIFLSAAFWQPYFETNFTGIFFWIITAMLIISLRLDDDSLKLQA